MIDFSLLKTKKKYQIPKIYFWSVFIICIIPAILSAFGVDLSYDQYKIISFSKTTSNDLNNQVISKTFNSIWIVFSIAVGFFTATLIFIDFKIKRDISAPIIGIVLICTSVFDLFHLLITSEALNTGNDVDTAIYFSWFISRILHAVLLLSGTLLILNIKPKWVKETKDRIRFIRIIGSIYFLITFTLIIYFLNVKIPNLFIHANYFITHPLELFTVFIYLIWGILVMPKLLKLYPSIFSQLLMLSIIPAVFSNIHMSVYYETFDSDYNFAQFLKLITYLVPLIGISLNYSRNITRQHETNLKLDKEIQEREKIQHDLEKRQTLLQHAEQMAKMGSWELDIATNEMTWSNSLYKIMGLKNSKVNPNLETMGKLVSANFRSDFDKQLKDAIDNESSFTSEYEIIRPDGKKRAILGQWNFFKKDKKLIGTCLDITDLKEANHKLEQNEALLRETEAISHNGSFEWIAETNHLLCSDELYQIHGMLPQSVSIDINLYQTFIHPEDIARCEKTLQKALLKRKRFVLEYRVIKPNNEVRFIYATAKILVNQANQIQKVIGNLQDITELKNTAILLEKTESIYRTIASNVPDSAVLMFDKNYFVILAEGPILDQLSYKVPIKVGLHINEIYEEQECALVKNLLESAFKGKEYQFIKEYPNRKIFLIDYKPVKNAVGEIFNVMMVMHNITNIKTVQKNLERKVEELNRSNKDLEQFAYVASHDLQEPLRKIRSFGDRLTSKLSNQITEEGLDYIRRMQNASERMQVLIDDLLTFSRITRKGENFVDVDLKIHIQKIIEDLEFTIEKKNAKINLEVAHSIKAIPGQIRQLFQNIISNALKFTKQDTQPVITIKSIILKGVAIGIETLNQEADYCIINVIDNGIGFDEQYADKIFELFQRLHTRNEFQGTGIGLAVCKKIVDNHNGVITVNSKLNIGTTFNIILPLEQL